MNRKPSIKESLTIPRAKALAVILEHINKPCPTNAQIARLAGLEPASSEKAVIALCRNKIITRIIDRDQRWFIINETGEMTAPGPFREMLPDCGTWRPHFVPSPGMQYPDGQEVGMIYKDVRIVTRQRANSLDFR